MSLPLPWVKKIFEKLTLTYGQQFLRRWSDIDLAAVQDDWAHELSGFEHAPHAIAYALANLPDAPPNVLQFRSVARAAPAINVLQLESPPADSALVARELAKIPVVMQNAADPKAWAKRLQTRELAGEKLGMAQKTMYRAALGIK